MHVRVLVRWRGVRAREDATRAGLAAHHPRLQAFRFRSLLLSYTLTYYIIIIIIIILSQAGILSARDSARSLGWRAGRPLFSGLTDLYARRLYGRIEDCWNRRVLVRLVTTESERNLYICNLYL